MIRTWFMLAFMLPCAGAHEISVAGHQCNEGLFSFITAPGVACAVHFAVASWMLRRLAYAAVVKASNTGLSLL